MKRKKNRKEECVHFTLVSISLPSLNHCWCCFVSPFFPRFSFDLKLIFATRFSANVTFNNGRSRYVLLISLSFLIETPFLWWSQYEVIIMYFMRCGMLGITISEYAHCFTKEFSRQEKVCKKRAFANKKENGYFVTSNHLISTIYSFVNYAKNINKNRQIFCCCCRRYRIPIGVCFREWRENQNKKAEKKNMKRTKCG